MFENKLERRMFEPQRKEIVGRLRKLHNEEFSSVSFASIIRIKGRRIGWEDEIRM
jgi:hypothetical protein